MVLGVVLEATGVTSFLSPEVQAEVIGIVMGVVNVAMRFVTTKPVTVVD